MAWLSSKLVPILRKGPSYARNIVYSKLRYWPVSRIDGCDLQAVPAYCISLERAVSRRRLIQGQVDRLGLKQFEFVKAIDSQQLNVDSLTRSGQIDRIVSRRYHPGGLTLNEIACSLSHRLAYAEVVARRHPVATILEDDALFVARRMRRFTVADVPQDFDVVLLNSFLFDDPPRGRVRGMVYEATSYRGSAAAYLVSQSGAQKLLEASAPVIHAADGLLGRCMELPPGERHPFKQVGATTTIKSYIVYPDCVLNGSTAYYHTSDVQPR
jgi:glycosyl transferase, family 25